MFRFFAALALFLSLFTTIAFAQQEKDAEGSADHPLLSRIPGFYISNYDVKDFDSYESAYLTGEDAKWDGKCTRLSYEIKTGAKPVSMTQIELNYENAVRKIGGKVLYHDSRILAAKIAKGGARTYVEVQAFNDGRLYQLVIVESKPMEQEVTADAEALKAAIASTGKAAVYGIYFDTGKSEIRPESEPALAEVAKLLNADPDLSLYVVGHTDNVGSVESNLKLSGDRAAAVVKALAARGIYESRLRPAGVGPYSPAASNSTEEGRAQNRRVELVRQ